VSAADTSALNERFLKREGPSELLTEIRGETESVVSGLDDRKSGFQSVDLRLESLNDAAQALIGSVKSAAEK
jgi:hypothetical protein